MIEKKHGKKYTEVRKLVEKKPYPVKEAVELLKKTVSTKFDPTCEVHFKLGLDPKHAEQNIRTTVALPNGTGKVVRVVAFVGEDKVKEAKAAGAIEAGTEELLAKIEGGWLGFDVAVATPDQMKGLGKVAKILGQKKLMPNPKAGTVTTDVAKTIDELKRGKIELRLDKESNLHSIFGKASFDADKLQVNLMAIIKTIVEAKPATSKGTYLQKLVIANTMGPGIEIDIPSTMESLK